MKKLVRIGDAASLSMKTSEKSKSKRIIRRGINSSTTRSVGGDAGTRKPSSSLYYCSTQHASKGTNKPVRCVGSSALSNEYETELIPKMKILVRYM